MVSFNARMSFNQIFHLCNGKLFQFQVKTNHLASNARMNEKENIAPIYS